MEQGTLPCIPGDDAEPTQLAGTLLLLTLPTADNPATRGASAAAAAAAKSRSMKRPQSRASTTSIHSATTQPNMDHSGFADTSSMYAGQWMANDKPMNSTAQMSTEEMMIVQAATNMQSGNHDFSMDNSMSAPMPHHHMSYQQQHPQQQHPMARHPLPNEQYGANASFTDGDTQMLDRDDNDDADLMGGAVGAPKPATRSSANNELEMRQLFGANRHRTLQDVAGELHGNERGPNSERTRQVFAMLWYETRPFSRLAARNTKLIRINSVCSKGKGSVPRGRVYANYASRCATERITVLNPASFGKLVRVLFPGLKTRRLGVRGESKYHYVNFALVEDQGDSRDSQPPVPRPLPEAQSFGQSFRLVMLFPPDLSFDANRCAADLSPSPTDLLVEARCPHLKALVRVKGSMGRLVLMPGVTAFTTTLSWPASTPSTALRPRLHWSWRSRLSKTNPTSSSRSLLRCRRSNRSSRTVPTRMPPSHCRLCIGLTAPLW